MNWIFSILLLLQFILPPTLAYFSADNPGLKLRITQKGLQYGAQEAINVLASQVRGKAIQDMSGDFHAPVIGHISYTLSGMKINEFTTPATSVTTVPFRWSVSDVGAQLQGDWKYKNHGFIHISDHGSFKVSLSRWGIATTITMGVDANGRPTAKASNCQCNAGDVSVKFSGGASWLYNLFRDDIADALKKNLQSQLCDSVYKAINVNGAKELQTLKVEVPVDKTMVLDYSLTGAPEFATTYLQTLHKGEVYWRNDNKTEAPFPAPPLPEIADSKMVTIMMSTYVVNTLAYQDYKHGAFQYNLTKSNLPQEDQCILNTNCSSCKALGCIGTFLPQLATKYPNEYLALGMVVNELPAVSVSDTTGISGNLSGVINVYASKDYKDMKFAFSLKTSVAFAVGVGMRDFNVTANITKFTMAKIELVKSDIGDIDPIKLQLMSGAIHMAVLHFGIPKMNDMLNQGIELPNIKGVQYVSPDIKLVKNAIVVMTDAKYVGESLEDEKVFGKDDVNAIKKIFGKNYNLVKKF